MSARHGWAVAMAAWLLSIAAHCAWAQEAAGQRPKKRQPVAEAEAQSEDDEAGAEAVAELGEQLRGIAERAAELAAELQELQGRIGQHAAALGLPGGSGALPGFGQGSGVAGLEKPSEAMMEIMRRMTAGGIAGAPGGAGMDPAAMARIAGNPELMQAMMEEQQLEMQLAELARACRAADEEAQPKIKMQLKEKAKALANARAERREQEVDMLRKRLAALEEDAESSPSAEELVEEALQSTEHEADDEDDDSDRESDEEDDDEEGEDEEGEDEEGGETEETASE